MKLTHLLVIVVLALAQFAHPIAFAQTSGPDDGTVELTRLKKLFDAEKVKSDRDFDLNVAFSAITDLNKLAENTVYSVELRSEAIRIAGGFEGKIAEKKGARGGIAHIRLSMQDFKEAGKLNPKNNDAFYDYGSIIEGMSERSGIIRSFLQLALHISLYNECKSSLVDLNRIASPDKDYIELVDQLNRFCP